MSHFNVLHNNFHSILSHGGDYPTVSVHEDSQGDYCGLLCSGHALVTVLFLY